MVLPSAVSLAIRSNSRDGLARGERGGRLVEDDDAGIDLQRLGDLDQLPLARRKPLDQRVGRQGEADRGQQRRRPVGERRAVDQPAAAAGKVADEDVLGDAQVGEEVELLVDEGDAAAFRLARAGGRVGRAVEVHGSGVGGHHAADDVHQGRFPGAVLPDEAENAAARDPQRHVLQGGDAEEALADAVERQDGVRHGCPAPMSRVRRTSSSAAARMIAPLTTSMWKAESRM